jgi:HPt (histidine-containing phosphotransfer) domain-containing protein
MLKLRNDNLLAAYNLCVRLHLSTYALDTCNRSARPRWDLVADMDMPAKAQTSEPGGAGGATPAAAPIDLDHLRRFTLGDTRLELEILWLFVDQTPVTLASMKRAATTKEWVMASHTLKGSARAVGAWRLAKLAEAAERLGGVSDRAACERALREIEEAADEARAHVALLGSPA